LLSHTRVEELNFDPQILPNFGKSLKTTQNHPDLYETFPSAMASTSSASDSQRDIARKTWELSNNMESVNSVDDVYRYDEKQQKDIQSAKPWDKE